MRALTSSTAAAAAVLSRRAARTRRLARCVAGQSVDTSSTEEALDADSEAVLACLRAEAERKTSALLLSPPAKVEKGETLRSQVAATLRALSDGLVERETEVRLLLLAAVCGEHLLLVGPPGTAKSELGRRLSMLCGGPYFERLLTRFSVPEELFGPLSLRALERDEYVRQTAGYLPEASVAFLDEIFKANSSILNSLLTIMNERLFDNGSSRMPVPLLCLVAASNELPDCGELDALFDRFLLRVTVAPVSDVGVDALLGLSAAAAAVEGAALPTLPLRVEELSAVRRAAQSVTLPSDVVQLLKGLRQHLATDAEPSVYVSDRRLVKAVALLRIAAHTCGRSRVELADALLLEHVFAATPQEAELIRNFVISWIASRSRAPTQFSALLEGLALRARSEKSTRTGMADEAAAIQQAILGELNAQTYSPLSTHLWLSDESVQRAQQTINSKGFTEQSVALQRELRIAVLLQCCLETDDLPLHLLSRAVVAAQFKGDIMARCVSVTRLEHITGGHEKFYEVFCLELCSRLGPLQGDPLAHRFVPGGLRYVLLNRWGAIDGKPRLNPGGWPATKDFHGDVTEATLMQQRFVDSKVRKGYFVVNPAASAFRPGSQAPPSLSCIPDEVRYALAQEVQRMTPSRPYDDVKVRLEQEGNFTIFTGRCWRGRCFYDPDISWWCHHRGGNGTPGGGTLSVPTVLTSD